MSRFAGWGLTRWVGVLAVAWTLFVWGTYTAGFLIQQDRLRETGWREARGHIKADALYRKWAAARGGVYVPIAAAEPRPDRGLDRDVETSAGRKLTLVCPSEMMGEAHRFEAGTNGDRCALVSLNPRDSASAPDPWERAALERFAAGDRAEARTVETIDGEVFARVIRPLDVEPTCLVCHEERGDGLPGESRGGVSVSVPLSRFRSSEARSRYSLPLAYAAFWLVGLVTLRAGAAVLRAEMRARSASEDARLQVERRHGLLLDGAVEGVLAADSKSKRFMYANPAVCRMFGYAEKELLELGVGDIHPPESLEAVVEEFDAIVRGEKTLVLGLPCLRRDGSVFHADVAGGAVELFGRVCNLGFFTDATERRRMEEALRESEARLRSVFRAAPSGIGLVRDRVLLDINDLICQMVGRSREELVGQNARILYPSDEDYEYVGREKYAQINRQGTGTVETRWRHKDGQVIDVLLSSTPLDLNDLSKGVTFTALDISGRKRALEDVQKLASIVRHSSELINLAAIDGTMVFLNDAGQKMLGLDAEEVPRTHVLDVVPEHLHGFAMDELFPALLAHGTWRGDLQYRNRKTGQVVDVHATCFSIADPRTGAPRYLANVSLDITDRKRQEKEKAALEEQLRQAEKLKAIGQLTGGVAHEFNNLLQVINGYASIALEELGPYHPAREALADIACAGDRAAALTRQLLAFSRQQVMRPENLDLNEAIPRFLNLIRRVIGEHVRLEFVPGPSLETIAADRGMIEQVLMNLCVNARDAMPEGGQLSVTTENVSIDEDFCRTHDSAAPGPYVLLSVSDTGCGMDCKTVDRIFEPFFTTKEVGKGTGLGLPTVYGIVRQHDGMIDIQSMPGKGTVVRVYLPAVDRDATPDAAAPEDDASGGTETILVAEDDAQVREFTRRVLERAGYAVLAARNGEEALALFEARAAAISAVVLDVVMPGMGGRDVYERMRDLRPGLRALFASGYSEDAIHSHFVLDGGLTLIKKPFDRAALLRAVRHVLDA